MGFFATRSRSVPSAGPDARAERSSRKSMGVPPRFQAVGEALASGKGSVEACSVLGHQLAQDGASLDECLEGLRITSDAVVGCDPSYADVRALSVAWSETTLGYLHQLSCEEPLTGLATLAHVRSRLSELHRQTNAKAEGLRDTHALVVVELRQASRAVLGDEAEDKLTRSLRMAHLGRVARTVFPGTEVIGRLGLRRIGIVAARDERLGRRVALVRRLAVIDGSMGVRVWIEGLPATDEATASVLDELARD